MSQLVTATRGSCLEGALTDFTGPFPRRVRGGHGAEGIGGQHGRQAGGKCRALRDPGTRR
jgi:hypothetical protein